MRKRLLKVSVVRALVIYLSASLLLAACGKREDTKRTNTYQRTDSLIVSKSVAEDKNVITGSVDNFSQDYVYLISKITPDGIGNGLTADLKPAQIAASIKMSEELILFKIIGSMNPSNKDKEENFSLAAQFYEKDILNKGKDQKDAELVTLELVPNADLRMLNYSGENDKYSVRLTCLEDNCSLATAILTKKANAEKKSESVSGYFFVSIKKAKITNADRPVQNVPVDETIKDEKGILKHPVSNLIANPNMLAMETNTINVITGESLIWVGLEGAGLGKGSMRIDISGRFVNKKADGKSIRKLNVDSTNNLVRTAQIVSHSEDGVVMLRLGLNPNSKKIIAKKEDSNKPTPKDQYDDVAADSKEGNYIFVEITPENFPKQSYR